MPGFFNHTIKTPKKILPDTPFNYQDEKHLELIAARVARFKEALEAVQRWDKSIIGGMVLCVGGFVANYIPLLPFTVPLAISGAFIAGYGLGCRSDYFTQYKGALEDLKEVYSWAMGKEANYKWYTLRTAEIQAMILTLGPWVSKETIHTWEPSDLRNGYLSSEKLSKDFVKTLTAFAAGEQYNNQQYPVYGENGLDNFAEYFYSSWNSLNALAASVTTTARTLAPR